MFKAISTTFILLLLVSCTSLGTRVKWQNPKAFDTIQDILVITPPVIFPEDLPSYKKAVDDCFLKVRRITHEITDEKITTREAAVAAAKTSDNNAVVMVDLRYSVSGINPTIVIKAKLVDAGSNTIVCEVTFNTNLGKSYFSLPTRDRLVYDATVGVLTPIADRFNSK